MENAEHEKIQDVEQFEDKRAPGIGMKLFLVFKEINRVRNGLNKR